MAEIGNKVKSTNDLELKDRLVAINRVTKVTKGGRTFSFAAIVVVGGVYGDNTNDDGGNRFGIATCRKIFYDWERSRNSD